MSYQSVSISSGGVSVINVSGGSVHISNSNGVSVRSSSKSYVSVSKNGIYCYNSASSVSITNSSVNVNNNQCIVAPKKKKSSKPPKAPKAPKPPKAPKAPKPPKAPKAPIQATTPKAPKLPSVKVPKALPPPPPSVASSTNRYIEPEDGYCWLLLFKSKYWNGLRSTFGPNTRWHINTPDNVLRTFMSQNPHMVSSRRDLLQRQTGPHLYHLTPGGNRSPWNVMGL